MIARSTISFILDWCMGGFLLHIGRKTAALNYKTWDHAVEDGVVVVAAVHVAEEVFGRNRYLFAVER